ncbi:hypothetical protein FA15DRAFT_671083 [Coprinopsis marcescibilis]|uniref:Uncharacterized protein n=1 Tax=Coprinopsis marcescibilis TaxID=230819 RepID=A0A5C3KR17_COPMA|nr:hypothetical protein FA15DRAFT_671083 [Coprinopsis marcescibilis]
MSRRGGNVSRKEAEYKSVRAKAHKEQKMYRDALGEAGALPGWRVEAMLSANVKKRFKRLDAPGKAEHPLETRRKAGDHASAVSARQSEFDDESVFGGAGDSDASAWNSSPKLDEVPKKVARKKGLRKEYEFVDNLNRVVVLDDLNLDAEDWRGPRSNLGLLGDEEDWEEVYSASRDAARSYSSVLRGVGDG